LICKYGEHPEDALPEKMRKAYEKKGLIKAVDIEPTDNDRYGDDEEQGYVLIYLEDQFAWGSCSCFVLTRHSPWTVI
jgi:hypothetical protein